MATSPHQRPYRWIVLLAYLPVVGLSQLLWLNFAPLLDQIEARYQVSEFTASLLILVFPLIFVLLSTHAGLLVDRRGYRYTIGLGSAVMALSSCVRVADGTFAALLIGQIGIAIAQPYVVNGITKLISDWFAPEETAMATGLGTMGMFIGMAIGMAATPWMVEHSNLRDTMIAFAVISIAGAAVFFAFVKPNEQAPAAPPAPAQAIRPLLQNRQLVLLLVLSFLGMGEFNGLTTWLEPILGQQHVSAENAGLLGGVLIIGGIFGAGIIPAVSGRFGRRKPFLIGCALIAALALYPLCSTGNMTLLIVLSAVHGFALLPAIALLLDHAASVAGEQLAGAATGLLMLAGNAGGVVAGAAVPYLKIGPSYQPAILMLVALLVAAVAVGVQIVEGARMPSGVPATANDQ